MQIYFKYNKEIDKEKWDRTISNSYNGILYAYSWVLDSLCEDWNALISGDYDYVFPLPTRRKFFIDYIYQPLFIQQLGLFSTRQITSEIISDFIHAIPGKYKWVDLILNTFNQKIIGNLDFKSRVTSELDLIETHHQIAAQYSENLRRNIRKAEKKGLISVIISPDLLVDFFIKTLGFRFPKVKMSDYQRLKRMLFLSLSKGKGCFTGVYDRDNNLCAAAAFIESNNKVIYLLASSSDLGKENGAMHFLIDDFIRKNCQRNLTLDFEGSQIDNLMRFYLSYGARKVYYPSININRLPFFVKLFKK